MARWRSTKGGNEALALIIAVIALIALIPKDMWIVIGILAGLAVVIRLGSLARNSKAPSPENPSSTPRISVRVKRSTASRNYEASRSVLSGRAIPPRWIPQGEPVTVAGITVTGGMLYFGSDLEAPSGSIEPALIEPRLPVSSTTVDLSFRQMGYWPSYSTIDPESRRAYLDWLATGRRDPRADVGYVFLFFYGLERRALIDAATDPTAKADLPSIEAEVGQLLAVYNGNRSFRGYAGQFLEYLGAQRAGGRPQQAPPPQPPRREMPLAMKVGLGQMAASGRPVPADWAFAWANADSTISSPKVLERCPKEFERLFIHSYKSRFGDGIKLPLNRTKLRLSYLPASGGFGGHQFPIDLGDIPDITAVVAPTKKMQAIVDECADALAPYSRFLGKQTDSGSSLDRFLLLPQPLWPEDAQSGLLDLNARVGDGSTLLTLAELASSFGATGPLGKDSVRALARAFQAIQIGVEPDVLSGVRAPKPEEPIALFRMGPDGPSSGNAPAYHAATVMLDLGCAVAMADGQASAGELQLLARQIDGWTNLGSGHHARLRARMQRGLASPPSLTSLKKKFEAIPADARRAIAHLMSTLAQVDGAVSPVEVKLLEKTYKALGFEAQAAYGDLHAAAAGTGAPADPSRSTVTPSTKKDAGFSLDTARIAALQKESEQVSTLLASVFVDEAAAPIEDVQEPDEMKPTEEPGLLGLDTEHTAFLRLLISRPSWSRHELADAAADMELMLDGVLERINEAALDNLKEPLIEGDDPIEISREAVEAMPE